MRRRELLSGGVGGLGALSFPGVHLAQVQGGPAAQALTPAGSRRLPPRFAGFNTPVALDIPYEDPRFRPMMRGLHTALVRFPGGSIANYWNWRTGRVAPPPGMQGTFRAAINRAPELHPQGASMEDFAQFARAIGSDVLLVLNAEGDDPSDQVEWVRHIQRKGTLPGRIELGNELYLEALVAGVKPDQLRYKDAATTMAIWRRYADAVRPLLPAGAKIAIQTSGGREKQVERLGANPYLAGLWDFDDGLTNEPWFDALTWHTYPEMAEIMHGVDPKDVIAQVRQLVDDRFLGTSTLRSDEDARTAFRLVMARVEAGTRRQARFLAERFPGKEIWVTEYGTGENGSYYRGDYPLPNAFWLHAMARMIMALATEPNVALIMNHSVYLDGLAWSCIRRADTEEGYKPIGLYPLFAWFNEALNSPDGTTPTTLVRLDVAGARQIAGENGESYADVVAIASEQGGRRTVLLQNVRDTAVEVSLAGLGEAAAAPDLAEAFVTPNLRETYTHRAPVPTRLPAGAGVSVPPLSVARLRWNAPAR